MCLTSAVRNFFKLLNPNSKTVVRAAALTIGTLQKSSKGMHWARQIQPPQISSAGANIAPPAHNSRSALCPSAGFRHSMASETTITGRPVSSKPRTA
jgi:hypothetical protein